MKKKNPRSFTGRKGNHTLTYQKAKYKMDEFKSKEKVQDSVTVTLSFGAEFNCDKEFKAHEFFSKYVKQPTEDEPENGVLVYKDGVSKRVALDKEHFVRFLQKKVEQGLIKYWDDRPRSAAELKLEAEKDAQETIIHDLKSQLAKYRKAESK